MTKTLIQPRFNPKNFIKPQTQIQNLIFLQHHLPIYKTFNSNYHQEAVQEFISGLYYSYRQFPVY